MHRRGIKPTSTQYSLTFLQNPLQYLFDHAVIPIYSGYNDNVIVNFIDYLPMVKQGYILDSALANLLSMTISADVNADIIYQAFGGDIPAFSYTYKDERYETKITMQRAVEDGIISNYLNTFQVMTSRDPSFDPDALAKSDLRWLSYLNKQNASDLPELNRYLQNENFRQILYHESSVIMDMYRVLEPIHRDMPEMDIITGATIMLYIHDIKTNSLSRLLIYDDRINLNRIIYAVIFDDPDLLEKYINDYDPRDNDFEAYHLAVELGNPIIIERIKKAITERNLLEQKTFQNMIVPLGESDIPQPEIFHRYSRNLL
jgi:hypothetical protein